MVYGDKEMKITLRIWVLIIVILISLLSIFGMPPLALEKGVMVTSVNQNSTAFQDGLRVGMVILQINGVDIKTLQDYSNAMQSMSNLEENQTQKLIIKTNSLEIINLFTKQGKFEAKIGNETVFVGGNKDITHVGRTGTDAIISQCYAIQGGEACNF